MRKKSFFLQIIACLANRIDILNTRGITLRNHTWADGAFYSGIESREVHVRMPIPKFTKDFKFRNGCHQIDKSIILPNSTHEAWNAILLYVIDMRIRNLFHPEEKIDETTSPKAPTASNAIIDNFDYLPSPLFAVDRNNIRHGYPNSVLPPDVIFPTNIIVSGLGELNNVPAITANKTGTFISFRCDKSASHYLRFVIPKPIKGMLIFLRNARPQLDFNPNFRVISLENNGGVASKTNNLCNVVRIFGSKKVHQAFILDCGTLAASGPVEVMLSMEFQRYCSYVRLVNLAFYPAEAKSANFWTKARGERNRRQFGEILGIVGLATGLASWGATWYHHSNDEGKIKNLRKNTELTFAHEATFDTTFRKDLTDTALVNEYTKNLVTTVHNELCSFETSQDDIQLEDFIDKLAWKFLTEIESTLTHASIPIEGNTAQKAAIQLCRSRNKDSLAHLCLNYYAKNNENYAINSVNFEKEDTFLTNAVLSITVQVPKFLPSQLMTVHRIMKVPIPLFVDEDKLYHFAEYVDLPEIFGHFPALNRRISLTNCKLFDDTYFCPVNLLNRLYSSESTCLNTVFSSKPSCKRRLIRSYASCIGDSDVSMLLVAHVGPIGVSAADSNPAWRNVQKYFPETANKILHTNITVFSGEAALKIRCEKSEFYFAGEHPVVVNFLQLENDTQSFPTMNSDLEGLESLQISDEKYDSILQQLNHVDDSVLKDQIKLKKLQNSPDFYKNLPISDETASTITDWAVPALAVVATLTLACNVFCCVRRFCKSTCCPTKRRLRAEYSVAKELCTRDSVFEVHQPTPISTEKSIPVTRRFISSDF